MEAQHLAACALLGVAPLLGCGSQPKQVAPPSIMDSGGEDIAPEEETELEPDAPMPDEMSGDEKKADCCAQCVKGLADDRTGQPPDKIPCADFTAVLEEFCLDYFRKSPLQASECKERLAAGAGDEPAAGGPADTDNSTAKPDGNPGK